MKVPQLLLGSALLVWGWASGQWAIAAVLALLVEGIPVLRAPPTALITLDDADRNRVVDLCSALTLALFVYFLVTQGVPVGLLTAVGWLPVALAPLLLAQMAAGRGFRAGNLSLTQRRSTRPSAQRVVDLRAPYFALLLLASSTVAARSVTFFVALSVLVACGLFAATRGAASRTPFFVVLALVFPSAYYVGERIHDLQGFMEDVVGPYFVGGASDPFKSQTRMGDLGRIKLSDRIIWRLDAPPSPFFQLRLRDGVYSHFDGKTWFARSDAFRPLIADGGRWPLGKAPDVAAGAVLDIGLTGHSSGGRSLLPLPLGALGVTGELGQVLANRTQTVKLEHAPSLLRARVDYAPRSTVGASPTGSDLALSSADADILNRLAAVSPEVSRQLLAAKPERQRVQAVEAFFEKNFRYTLFLGRDQADAKDVERFLLKDRNGHCEYFATATVLLLRYLGIPARYVTGYSAHEYSALEQTFVVRRRDAHAWVEAAVDGRWIEVDTTPSTWVGAEESHASVWQPILDFVAWAWFAFQTWWVSDGSMPTGLAWLFGGASIVLMVRLLWRRRARQRPHAVNAGSEPLVRDVYSDFEELMRKKGHPRASGETPHTWLARLRREGCPALDELAHADADAWVAACYQRRYGEG